MTAFEEKLNAYDPNWRERVYNVLGIIISCDEYGLDFYSAAGHFTDSDLEIGQDISSDNNVDELISLLFSAPGFENCLQDMNLGNFTKFELFVSVIINLLIPTVKATYKKYGKDSCFLFIKNIEYRDNYDCLIDNKYVVSPCLLLHFDYVGLDESYCEIPLPTSMSLEEALSFIKDDLTSTICTCDIPIVIELSHEKISLPHTYNELLDFCKLIDKWSLRFGDALPE